MRTNQILLLLFSFSITSCSYYQHLEDQSEFDKTEHGSFIRVWEKQEANISSATERQGELIAIDSDSLYLLVYQAEADTICMGIHRHRVDAYSLYYAKPNTRFWTIPAITLLSASHGMVSIISAPINLIATSFVQGYVLRRSRSEESDFKIDELSPYARFPRGIPSNIKVNDIR